MNRKGMVSNLTAVAFGIIGLVILVGIGMTVLSKLSQSVVDCSTVLVTGAWNATSELCSNATASATPTTPAFTSIQYGITQISSTGLLSWLPAIIALLIGIFFLSYFAGKKQGKNY